MYCILIWRWMNRVRLECISLTQNKQRYGFSPYVGNHIKEKIMKIGKLLAAIFFVGISIGVTGQTTIVKGKVHKWVSDTVYICEMPFNSPHSSLVNYQVISKDSTFQFEWDDKEAPFIICIAPLKSFIDNNLQNLLFQNLTEKYYYSQCIKFYTYGSTAYLIEPNTTLNIDLTANTWVDTLSDKKAEYLRSVGAEIGKDNAMRDYGKTEIRFKGTSDSFSNNYYQKFFKQRNKLDNTLEAFSSKNIHMAMINLEYSKQGLLTDLEMNKEKMNPVFYDYLKAEIEFGAKKEFLKYLRFEKPDYLKEILTSGSISEPLLQIIAFDKYSINNTTLISEMYNEYIEFYLNFVMNMVNKEYIEYRPFNMEKLQVAAVELPEKSAYYYIANHLLNLENKSGYKKICNRMMQKYPDEELNDKLKERFGIN